MSTQDEIVYDKDAIEKYLLECEDWVVEEDEKLGTKYIEGTIQTQKTNSYPDGVEIHYKQFKQVKPKALIVILHGIGNASGLQGFISNPLRKQNYEIVAFDQVGHGKSHGGGECLIYDFRDFYQVSWSFLSLFLEKNDHLKGVPIFLFGNSMGGGIAIEMCLHQEKDNNIKIDGLILCAPSVVSPRKPSAFLGGLLSFASTVYPSFQLPGGVDMSQLTRVPSEQKRRKVHPDVIPPHQGLAICTAREMLYMMDDIQSNLDRLDIPMLLMHGEKDTICLIEGSVLLDSKNQSKDKTFIKIPWGNHSLPNDYTAFEVMDHMKNWLVTRCK